MPMQSTGGGCREKSADESKILFMWLPSRSSRMWYSVMAAQDSVGYRQWETTRTDSGFFVVVISISCFCLSRESISACQPISDPALGD